MIQIRTMTAQDYDAVYDLWIHTPGMALNTTDDSPEGLARYLARNPFTSFLAEEEGRAVGTILAGQDGRRGYIYHVAVRPEYRRQGIASQLVLRTLEALKGQGIPKAALVTFTRNREGAAFWAHMGFTEREDLTYRNREIVPIERMET